MRRLPIIRVSLGFLGLIACWLAAACSTEARLREAGPTPYVRCMAAPAPEERVLRMHGITLASKHGVLGITGIAKPAHLVAFSGAGFGPAPSPLQLAELAASGADLFIMLGGLGDDDAAAAATALALSKLPRPVLFVAGGRDRLSRVQQAFDALPAQAAVVDLTRLREVRIGDQVLLPIPGAEDGHYALDEDSCGFGLPDLKTRAGQLGKGARRRWLLAWTTPAGPVAGNLAQTPAGLELGAPGLAEFARRVGVAGGLYAWPETQLGLAAPGAANVLVPRFFGPIPERSDGSRAPLAFARVQLDDDGLRFVD